MESHLRKAGAGIIQIYVQMVKIQQDLAGHTITSENMQVVKKDTSQLWIEEMYWVQLQMKKLLP
jgi:hypothetical protein